MAAIVLASTALIAGAGVTSAAHYGTTDVFHTPLHDLASLVMVSGAVFALLLRRMRTVSGARPGDRRRHRTVGRVPAL